MTPAYSELYLEDAMRTLGESFDYAIECKLTLGDFVSLFIATGYARRFEHCEPAVVSGMSGIELTMAVLHKMGWNYEKFPEVKAKYHFSHEYWCGHILAYYQWSRGLTFKEIFDHISIEEIRGLYNPLHEASEERAAYSFDRIISSRRVNKLSKMRKLNKITQKELSERSGVSLRSIQQYEIGAKDINKASALSVRNLANALHCEVEDLLSIPLNLE